MTNQCENYLRMVNNFGLTDQNVPLFAKIRFIKSVINQVSAGTLTADDVEATCIQYFAEHGASLGMRSTVQQEIVARDCARQILRYVNFETRTPVYLPAKEVSIGGLKKMIRPDRGFMYKDTNGDSIIEVVKFKCSKPKITQAEADKGSEKALDLYNLLQYGRTLVRGKGVEHVVASFYYLGKASDRLLSDDALDAHFDTNFFDHAGSYTAAKGGKNIIRLIETYRNGRLVTKEYDSRRNKVVMLAEYNRIYEEAIAENYKTKNASDCSAEDCAKCPIHDLCQYTMPPKAVELEKSTVKAKRMKLNPAQQQATDYDHGIVRINAGAGTGKTNTVKSHFISLCDKEFDPKKILVITFTNSGAEEMRARILSGLTRNGINVDPAELSITTFNAFGYDQIKKHYRELGYTAVPKLIDDIERSSEIAKILNSVPQMPALDYRNFSVNTKMCKGALAVTGMVFSLAKKYSLSVADSEECRQLLASKYSYALNQTTCGQILNLYSQYDANLHALNLIEFDDQITSLFELVYQDPDFIENLGYEHIIVDEFQDTDQQQINLLKELINTTHFQSLMVVGDDAQAIYGFRDTSTEFIINFEKYIGRHVDDIYLLDNYRCSPEVIDFANRINAKNHYLIEKDLVATRPSGDPVTVMGFGDSKDEYSYIVEQIKQNIADGVKPEDICFIAYTKSELQKMADLLAAEDIPSVLMNPELLKENSRVQAGLALLAALQNPLDTKSLVTYASAKADGTLINARYTLAKSEINSARAELETVRRLPENAKRAKIIEMLKALDRDDEVYESFIATIEFKPTVNQIYDYIADFEDFGDRAAFRRNKSYPGVVLTTAHSSKGLEWPYVYVTLSSFQDKSSSRSLRDTDEVRRLLFVAATRAKDRLVITGKWVAYKDERSDVYNQFLLESFDATDQKLDYLDAAEIMAIYRDDKKKERAEAKLKKLAEADTIRPARFAGRKSRRIRKQGKQLVARRNRIVLK